MSIQDYGVLYNLLFIVILIFVGGAVSLFTVWMYKKSLKYWLFSTVYFVVITFTTISLWYLTIGFTF